MKLYTTPKGRWAGTQTDAKAIGKEDGGWSEAEVPTDKPGLLAFLNKHSVGAGRNVLRTGLPDPAFANFGQAAVEEEAHLRSVSSDTYSRDEFGHRGATAQQIADANPNSGLAKSQAFDRAVGFETAVEEHIQNARYPRLATLAQNVAWRFEELAKDAAAKPVPAIFDAPEAEQEDDPEDDPLLA